MQPTFIDNDRVMVGVGSMRVVDPGTGRERYRRAFESLTASEREIAFASFTFDPDERGSVVIIPDQISDEPTHVGEMSPGLIIDDGIEDWRKALRLAMAAISAGTVAKVVVARRVRLETQTRPEALLAQLARRHGSGFVYGVGDLVGATPELLARVSDGHLESEVLAGTAPREGTLDTEKLSAEHSYAARSAVEPLRRLLMGPPNVETGEIAHGLVKHRATRISGATEPGTTVLDALAALHPTAAVAGTPTDRAVSLIREIETSPRGAYGGPVGWFDREGNGVFAVAIRSAQFGDGLVLHAGGGLVAGSVEADELEETELKLRTVLDAFQS